MQSRVPRALVFVCALLLLPLTSDIVGAKDAPSPKSSVLDQDPIPRTPERMARGKYLVNGILQCFNCHSDVDFTRRPSRPVPGKMGGGKIFSNTLLGLPPGNRVVASNISPDPEYGAGKWKDSDFVRALRQGIGHDGRTLFPVMPYNYFHKLSDEDLAAAIVYVRSIPPVHIERPKTVLTPEIKATLQPLPPVENVAAPDKSDRVKYGAYLVNAAHCNGCHTPADDKTGQPLPDMYLGGGDVLTGPWGPDPNKEISVASLNLTPDPSGISYMNEALFIEAMRTGQVKARLLANIMPWAYFRNLSDDDLKAMYAYLRTVKPVQHRVDNTEPPGYCKLCRHRHGFGDRNKMAEAPSPVQPASLRENSPRH
jgi:mono/diheme cytochrome c family protein